MPFATGASHHPRGGVMTGMSLGKGECHSGSRAAGKLGISPGSSRSGIVILQHQHVDRAVVVDRDFLMP